MKWDLQHSCILYDLAFSDSSIHSFLNAVVEEVFTHFDESAQQEIIFLLVVAIGNGSVGQKDTAIDTLTHLIELFVKKVRGTKFMLFVLFSMAVNLRGRSFYVRYCYVSVYCNSGRTVYSDDQDFVGSLGIIFSLSSEEVVLHAGSHRRSLTLGPRGVHSR